MYVNTYFFKIEIYANINSLSREFAPSRTYASIQNDDVNCNWQSDNLGDIALMHSTVSSG